MKKTYYQIEHVFFLDLLVFTKKIIRSFIPMINIFPFFKFTMFGFWATAWSRNVFIMKMSLYKYIQVLAQLRISLEAA